MKYRKNSRYIVTALPKDENLRIRLENLGFTEGAEIRFGQTAPLGNPVIAFVRGTSYAFRLSTLEKIDLRRQEF